MASLPFLTDIALLCAVFSASIVVYFLVARPSLSTGVKLVLMLGLGVFPIGAAMAGNVQGFEATKARRFCGSCHLMTPYTNDAGNLDSRSLAARHGRNVRFGDENCYVCHADYGMFGTILTKIGGMRHVWLNATEYRNVSLEQARVRIHLRSSFPNQNCMQCHSTEDQLWSARTDHRALLQDLRDGRMSCASPGCHGYAHPFTKDAIVVPSLEPAPVPPSASAPSSTRTP